jgi:hypothetical protein
MQDQHFSYALLVIQHGLLSFVKHIQHHGCPKFPSPNFQLIGGVCSNPLKGIFLSFL